MPERQVGRYTVLDEFAAGGMATIHFGRLTGPAGFSRVVAIKRLHAELSRDPEFVAMFLDEARLAARIRHPNVVSTLDVVAAERELFIVLEYIEGESLARLARLAGSALPIPIAVAVVVGALHGLHAAHEARDESGSALTVIHRDVSPQNVIVGVDGIARMVDFGVAKAAGRSQRTRAGVVKGKVAYMAPEQVSGGVIDRRTDIYAASVMLWELLTGRRLFEGDNDFELAERVRNEGMAQPPSKLRRGVSKKLDAIVMQAASANPNRRPATAIEMADALERALRPASPRQVSEWVRSLAGSELAQRAARFVDVQTSQAAVAAPVARATARPKRSKSTPPPPVDRTREVVAAGPPASAPYSVPPSAPYSVPPSAPYSTAPPPAPSVPPPSVHPPAPPRRRVRPALAVFFGVTLAVVLFSFGVTALRWLQSDPAAGEAMPEAAASEPAPTASAAATHTPASVPSATKIAEPLPEPAASSAPLPSASAAASVPPPRPRIRYRPKPPAPKRDCDPPYFYEGRIKKYKPGCI